MTHNLFISEFHTGILNSFFADRKKKLQKNKGGKKTIV